MTNSKKTSPLSPLIAEAIGKRLFHAKTFDSAETFHAYDQAEEYCKSLGLSVGHMCSPMPTGVKKGDFDIAKWKNLDNKDKREMDGVIVAESFRDGPVSVYLVKELLS